MAKFLVPIDVPSLTTAPDNPIKGRLYVDDASGTLRVWDGSRWQEVPDTWLWERLELLESNFRLLLKAWMKIGFDLPPGLENEFSLAMEE